MNSWLRLFKRLTMSTIFTLSGNSSVLSADFNPPILLDDDHEYVMGLLSFESYNTIPNITKPKNVFQLTGRTPIVLPEGAYEINDINNYIRSQLNPDNKEFVELQGENSTMRTTMKSSHDVDFTSDNSIGELLGFNKNIYKKNKWTTSENITNIMKINSILIHCNISLGSYKNGKPGHIIHQFFPTVPSGYKIVESPNPVIYLPISTKTINNITIKILDQDDEPISFSSETITVGLHLKKQV